MLVWVEPFEEYGTNMSLPGNNGYTVIGGVLFNGGRTGTIALQINGSGWRRALAATASVLGSGIAIQPVSGAADAAGGLGFRSGGIDYVQVLRMGTDNSVGIYVNGTLKGRSAANLLPLGVYNWLEAKCIQNTGGANTGSVEARVNGVQVLLVNGVDIPSAFDGMELNNPSGTNNFDDWIIWDGTGTVNKDFMGDRRLYCSFPTSNAAAQDFVASAGSAWGCVAQTAVVDTTYIEGAAAGNVSEFNKAAIGINSNDIAAMVVMGRLFKTDAGACTGKIGIDSAANVSNSPDINPGTTGAFFQYIVEKDPNGNVAWTRANADAAVPRITRTV